MDTWNARWFARSMIIHTLVFSFPDAMTQSDRDQFFAEIGAVISEWLSQA